MYLPTYLEIIIKIIFLLADNQHRVRYYFKNTPLRRANLGTITLFRHQFSARVLFVRLILLIGKLL